MPSSDSNDRCIFFLVRHGATDNNTANPPRLQGRKINPSLSVAGREQAEKTGQLLASRTLSAVYASPLVRALETAEAVAGPHGLEVTTVDALMEADLGNWEGRDWIDIQNSEPEAYERFMTDPGAHGYTGGENFAQVQQRAIPVFNELAQQHAGETIAVVAHNVVNRTMLAHLLGVPVSKARDIVQDNCGVNVIHAKEGSWKVRTSNGVFHLW